MTPPKTFSPATSYLWSVFDEHGDSDDLDRYYGQGEPVAPNLRQDCESLRRLYPELSGWGLNGLFWAWSAFETDHLLVGSSCPHRTEMFLGYIILRSVAGFTSDNLGLARNGGWDEIDQALRWRDGKDCLPAPR